MPTCYNFLYCIKGAVPAPLRTFVAASVRPSATPAWLTGGFSPVSRRARDANVPGMRSTRRTLVAVAIAVAAAAIGMTAWTLGRVDPGMTFGTGTDAQGRVTLTIASVTPGGLAWYSGLHAGYVVLNVDGIQTLPGDPAILDEVNSQVRENLAAIPAANLDQFEQAEQKGPLAFDYNGPEEFPFIGWAPERVKQSWNVFGAGYLLCLFGFLWLRSANPGPALRGTLITIVAAAATPLFLVPAYLTLSPAVVMLVSILTAAAVLLAALEIAQLIGPTRIRRTVVIAAAATAGAAAVVGCVMAFTGMERSVVSETRWGLASATVILPGLVAAWYLRRPSLASQLGRTIDSIEVGAAATLPAFALMPLGAVANPPFLTPLLIWVLVVVALRVFAFRPLARLAAQSAVERELVVDDSESERRRIAGDIHDDVIQDLTMLVHRLDRDGDKEPAEVVRRAVQRLRDICTDLRLPVLDDLGLGAAIHALVAELEHVSGGHMDLELEGEGRLPADIELTFFRIAQETLANAVKHGRPPIAVRLKIKADGAELQIDDSGPGIPAGVLTSAPAEGHMGLLSMTQRAQQIGAPLEIGERPGGGTRVRIVWSVQATRARSTVATEAAH